ncbi:hypothetical protein LQW54_010753 [Pestalotiopsis sp. IQ-011]
MARYTHALGRAFSHEEPDESININLKLVDIHRNGTITEDYLLNVNPKGQVPALTGGDLSAPLTDSLDISFWLCDHFPILLPDAHELAIRELLSRLHKFKGLSLSVTSKTDRHAGVPLPELYATLARSDISQEYRSALKYKKQFHRETQEPALREENVEAAERSATLLFADVLKIYTAQENGAALWIFGETPTVLDAHLVPLIARLLDCERTDLVPTELQVYALAAMSRPEYQAVTHGRRTLWDVSVGHVHLLEDF